MAGGDGRREEGERGGHRFAHLVPPTLRGYRPAWLRGDASAGAALACILVPQGLAYAGIAGVPPEHGLFAAAAGLALYGLFGTSRHLAVSPTSSSAALLAASVGPVAGGDPARYIALAAFVAMCTGLLFLLGRLLRLGFISEFIAGPVIKGFIVGLALTVIAKQAPDLFGLPSGHGDFFQEVLHLLRSLPGLHPHTAAVGLLSLAALLLLGRFAPRAPGPLIVLALAVAASELLDLGTMGVPLVGVSAREFPIPRLPGLSWPEAVLLLQCSLGIGLVVFAEATSSSRAMASRHGYQVDSDRELMALGIANLASGAVQGIAVSGGLSGTAANERAGARSQLSGLFASVLTVLTLVFLLPLFGGLPIAALGAVVVYIMGGLVGPAEFLRYRRLHRGLGLALFSTAAVLVFGLLAGLLLAVLTTIAGLLYYLSKPHCSVLGRLPGTDLFVQRDHHPEAEEIPGLLIFRPDAPILFSNAHFIAGHLRKMLDARPGAYREVLLSFELVPDLGPDGLDMLLDLERELGDRGVDLDLCRVKDQVHDLLERGGLLEVLGPDRVFLSQREAVHDYLRRHPQAMAAGAAP